MSSLNLFQTNKEMENSKTQTFENMKVDTILKDEAIFFKLTDIEKVLELTAGQSARWIKDGWFDDDEITELRNSQLGGHSLKYVAESGLYRILNRTNSPKAKPFERWVTKEVLPAIRKTGEYKIQKQETLISADFLRKIADEMEKKDLKISLLENQIESEKPLLEFSKQIATSANAISVRDFAKILYDENIKMGEKQLFHWLRLCGYLTSENMPYQRYLGAGYFEVKQSTYKTPYGEKSYTQTLITGKGQIYFCEKLRKEFK